MIFKKKININKAIKRGNIKKLKEILSQGLDVNEIPKNERISPLGIAASRNIDMVKLLIEYGANINSPDVPLDNSLMCRNNLEITKLLVEKGADINLKDKNNSSPLETAMVFCNLAGVKYLIEKGAKINYEIFQQYKYDYVINPHWDNHVLIEEEHMDRNEVKNLRKEITEFVKKHGVIPDDSLKDEIKELLHDLEKGLDLVWRTSNWNSSDNFIIEKAKNAMYQLADFDSEEGIKQIAYIVRECNRTGFFQSGIRDTASNVLNSSEHPLAKFHRAIGTNDAEIVKSIISQNPTYKEILVGLANQLEYLDVYEAPTKLLKDAGNAKVILQRI